MLLDLPDEEAEERRRGGGEEPDRIERAGADFRRAVRDGYLALAEAEPSVVTVDARGAPEEVHARVRERITARFPEVFSGAGAAPGLRQDEA